MDDLETGVCQEKCIGIGKAYILGSGKAETPGNEQRILTSVEHPGEVIYRCIGIGAADGLYEGGNDVEVHLPVLVIYGKVLLNAIRYGLVADDYRTRLPCERIHDDFQDVQEFPCITSAVAE